MQEIETDLMGLLSWTEGSFEFFEEEQQDLDVDTVIKENMRSLLSKIKKIKTDFAQQQQIRQGIKISILGWVNVGKSTLFNTLLQKDRAIVTNIEGTTRDSIESSLYKDGIFWQLVDTAGLRQTSDFIEKEGIDRSWQQAAESDIVLLVFDLSCPLPVQQVKIYKKIIEKYHDKIIMIANKVDIEDEQALKDLDFIDNFEVVKVSASQKRGIELLQVKIENKIQELFSKFKSPFLLNQRQYNLIAELEQKLEFVVKECCGSLQCELIAYHVKEMLEKLSQLTGRNVTEKMLDRVFSDFCIGK